jgi:serralysin
MTLSFSGSMTTVGGETLENVDIDVIFDSNENPVSMTGTATLNGNQVVFEHSIIADTFANSTVGITTDTNGDTTVIVTDTNGNTTTITDVENFNFSDQNFDTAGLHANTEVRDLFYQMVLNDAGTAYDQVYVMPELFLFPGNPALEALYDYSYVMPTDNTVGDIIVGSSGNDFINGMGGGDGIIAGDGNDVIDGGLGSNFLTGGNGDDVFFADGRGAHVAGWTREDDEVWTTVTDFNNGNSQATIWGYIDGTSTYTWEANQGAAGWEGITLRADLDGNGVVDTSFTFTGIDNQSELTLTTNVVGDLGYILVS